MAVLRLVLALEAGGIPLEVVGPGGPVGRLSLSVRATHPGRDPFEDLAPSFRERCESMGLDRDFVGSFFEAGGLPRPGLDDPCAPTTPTRCR